MHLRRKPTAVRGLNITPMIDVVFILLVFFMLATNFANFRLIRIEAPEETRVVDDSDAAIVILLKSDGTILFDGEQIPDGGLQRMIATTVALDPGRTFLIRPEDGVDLQAAIDVFGIARLAGARSLSFSPPQENTTGAGQ